VDLIDLNHFEKGEEKIKILMEEFKLTKFSLEI